MTIEDTVFQKIMIDPSRLRAAGFHRTDNEWICEEDFCDDAFTAVLTIDNKYHLTGKVIEKETGEEYLPLRVDGAVGEFVHHVREEYTEILKQAAIRIGKPVPFQSEQANRLALKITEKYGDAPDFPWNSDSEENGELSRRNVEYADYGVFRHPDNDKWYGLLMYTAESNLKTEEEKAAEKKRAELDRKKRAEERRKREEAKKAGKKLPPVRKVRKKKPDAGSEKKVNIFNLKIKPDTREALWKRDGIYPAFHMNSKSWISVRLDDSLTDDEIMKLVDTSFRLTSKAGTHHERPDGRRVWIVPANPKYYDIVSVFNSTDDTIWKQGKGIRTGDTVYMYVAVPYSAILYRCTVTQAHSAVEDGMDLMDVHIDERYDPKLCTLGIMKQFRVNTVRGPRFMPEELEQYIRKESIGS